MILELFFVFLLTFLIELIVYFIFIRERKLKIVYYCFLINLFTWPLANIFYVIFQQFYLIEFFVILIEGFLILLLFKLKWEKAIIISLISNMITAGLSFFF